MRLQDVPSRDEVEELMSRSEFQYPKSLMERLGEWINDLLERLFGNREIGAPNPGAFGGGVGQLVGWLLVVAAIAAVILVVVLAVRGWVRRDGEEEEPLSDTEVEHRRAAKDWAGEAEDHEGRGEWKLAVRARYRELVRTLTDRHQVVDLAGRTTGELRDDLAVTTPSAAEEFDTACLLFELPWYADVPTGEDEVRRLRAAAARVLAAEIELRVHEVPVAELATIAVGTASVGEDSVGAISVEEGS